MRPRTEAVYGITPERVVGTSMELEYEVVNGKPEKWWALKDLNLRPIDYESSYYPSISLIYIVLILIVSLIV